MQVRRIHKVEATARFRIVELIMSPRGNRLKGRRQVKAVRAIKAILMIAPIQHAQHQQ